MSWGFGQRQMSETGGRNGPWIQVVSLFVGLLLLVSAVLKAYELATRPVVPVDLFTQRWVLLQQVIFEIILGTWLVSGLWRRLAWWIATACFFVFIGVTFYKGLTGQASCGCFGAIQVNPWYTLVLDVLVLAALLVFRPRTPLLRPGHFRLRLAGAVTVIVAGLAVSLTTIARYEPARLSVEGDILGTDRFVLLDPETWIGKPLPLGRHIRGGDRLAKGAWTVVLYYPDCPKCRTALPEIVKKAADLEESGDVSRVALVQMPQDGQIVDCPVENAERHCLVTALDPARDWAVASPAVIGVVDGKVVSAVVDEEQVQTVRHDGLPIAAKVAVDGDKASHDFGYVQPGSAHRMAFVVSSSRLARVEKVVSECKCMAVAEPPKKLEPGQTQVIVDFVAPKESLRYSKRILIRTDDTPCRTLALRVKADVGLPLAVDPGEVILEEADDGQYKGRIILVNRGSDPIRPVYGTSSNLSYVAQVPRAVVEPGGRLEIPVVFTGSSANRQPATVSIHTDSELQPQIGVRVRLAPATSNEVASRQEGGN